MNCILQRILGAREIDLPFGGSNCSDTGNTLRTWSWFTDTFEISNALELLRNTFFLVHTLHGMNELVNGVNGEYYLVWALTSGDCSAITESDTKKNARFASRLSG